MINVLFNFDGDIEQVKQEFNINFTPIPEMLEGSYMCIVKNADDFDIMDDFMIANGNIEVISGFDFKGKQYSAKKDKNKYSKTKYKKWLKDKYELDSEGLPTNVKLPKDTWKVNKYMGWADREL